MKLKNTRILANLIGVVLGLLLFSIVTPAQAQQSDEMTMNLRRDFGYSSGGGDIQGLFTWSSKGPENLIRVEFYIDNQLVFEDAEAPYKFQFNTDSYPNGLHTFTVIGYTSDGNKITSKEQKATFVSAAEGWASASKIVLPLGGTVVGIILLSFVIPLLTSGRKKIQLPYGTPRNYGLKGGAVCPKCQRPFVLHLFSLNMLTHKFDRCPYCGKWSLVKPLSQDKLRLAEQAELKLTVVSDNKQEISEDDKLRKDLDDSRFQGL